MSHAQCTPDRQSSSKATATTVYSPEKTNTKTNNINDNGNNATFSFGSLFNNPITSCISPTATYCGGSRSFSTGDDDMVVVVDGEISYLDSVIPPIIKDINGTSRKQKSYALERLYDLTDLSHKHYRVKLVCTSKYDILDVLAKNISSKRTSSEDRKLCCLILNNLSIPFENKAVMTLGPYANNLLNSLCNVIKHGYPESYLCCICLFNMSFLDDAQSPMLYYSPTSLSANNIGNSNNSKNYRSNENGNKCASTNSEEEEAPSLVSSDHSGSIQQHQNNPLDDPLSLVRIIELMIQTYLPYVLGDGDNDNSNSKRNINNQKSVEGEAIRWGIGLIRNLTVSYEDACDKICRTNVPYMTLKIIKYSSKPLERWTKDSLEDLCLATILNLAQYHVSLGVLKQLHANDVVSKKLIGKGGIHDLRASTIRCKIESYSDTRAEF